MYRAPTQDELVEEYRRAFESGDAVTSTEILQFAKYDPALSGRLLAVENEVLAAGPDVAIDLDRVVSVVNSGPLVRHGVDRAEHWVTGHEFGIRATFRYWPIAAALGFGLCLYALGQSPLPPVSWWLLGLAMTCIGSIAVVCASSIWREYPAQSNRLPVVDGEVRGDEGSEGSGNVPEDADGRIVVMSVRRRERRYNSFLPPLAAAASVGAVAIVVFADYTSGINDRVAALIGVEEVLDERNLLAHGRFEAIPGLVVPLRARAQPGNGEPVLIGAKVEGSAERENLEWSLSVVDEDGALVGVARAQTDSAILALPDHAHDGEQVWYAFLELADRDRSRPVTWSMYGRDVEAGQGVGLKEGVAAMSPADFRVGWLRDLQRTDAADGGGWQGTLERAAEHESVLVDPQNSAEQDPEADSRDDGSER